MFTLWMPYLCPKTVFIRPSLPIWRITAGLFRDWGPMSADLIHVLPDLMADRAPSEVAFVVGAAQITFESLAKTAGQLAYVLQDAGVRKGDRVGLFLRKSLRSAIGVYGITRAGAAYVPLDPTAPPERLVAMMAHCGIRHLVTDSPMRPALAKLLALRPDLDAVIGADDLSWEQIASAPTLGPAPALPGDIAYLMFTSGSTGVPKAMVHTHRSGLAYARAATKGYGVGQGDRISLHAALHFDMSTLALFGGPLVGAVGVIVPDAVARLPAECARLMADQRITHWYSVPFALIEMLDRGALESRDLSALRWIIFAGEPFAPQHLRRLMRAVPDARFSNHYGPAEVNVCTTYDVPGVESVTDDGLPIGAPWDIAAGLVLDGDDNEVQPGEVGELVVRSASRMRGYWSDPARSEAALYRREITPGIEGVFYRTGDLVQDRGDGQLRYLGRKDRQIKLRGFRIELSEVELALGRHARVTEASAFANGDALEAAVTLESEADEADIRADAARTLPAYAVPQKVHVLPALPRTATGKINHRAVAAQILHQTGAAPVQGMNMTGETDG